MLRLIPNYYQESEYEYLINKKIYLSTIRMPRTIRRHSWLQLSILLLSLIYGMHAITQKCTPSNISQLYPNPSQSQPQCPNNSKCNQQGYCACEPGYFGNCQNSGFYIDSLSKEFNITQNNSYFLIEPMINEFVNFQFILCNQKSMNNNQLLNLWVDDGNLIVPTQQNSLGNDKELKVQQGCIALMTSYFTFNLQPNGQKQTLIFGLRLRNPGNTKVQILVQQISIFGFDIILKILFILVGGIVIVSLGSLFYCMYKCRRRRRHGLNEQKLDISFFDEYMPAKKGNLQEMKEEICSVCLGDFKQNQEIRPTVCAHYFHKICLDEWCVTNLSCPICRTSFQKANLIHQQYLISRENSTHEDDSIRDGIINGEGNLREPIV